MGITRAMAHEAMRTLHEHSNRMARSASLSSGASELLGDPPFWMLASNAPSGLSNPRSRHYIADENIRLEEMRRFWRETLRMFAENSP